MRKQKRKLTDFKPLWKAEEKILADLDNAHMTVLGEGDLPDADAGDDRRVRASFIRWCALGGDDDHQVHEAGVRVKGALIVSDGEEDAAQGRGTAGLNLEGAKAPGDLVLWSCRFEDPPILRGARMQTLNLQGAALPGIEADSLETKGGVFLRQTKVTGEARFLGAKIGGDFDCAGGRFVNARGNALSADRLETRGGVFLRQAEVTGEARFLDAKIGGEFACTGGRFENEGGTALNIAGATIAGRWFWRAGATARGAVDLTEAGFGAIVDDPECWPEAGNLLLDRCSYGAFTAQGVSAGARLKWLGLQKPEYYGADFWPQPWEHCAAVLREMGHSADARAILVDKEERQRADKRRRLEIRLEAILLRERLAEAPKAQREGIVEDINDRAKMLSRKSRRDELLLRGEVLKSPVVRGKTMLDQHENEEELSDDDKAELRKQIVGVKLNTENAPPPIFASAKPTADEIAALRHRTRLYASRIGDCILGAVIDYGQRPLKAVYWLALVWLLGAATFLGAWQADAMKPNNPFILRSAEWVACGAPDKKPQVVIEGADEVDWLRLAGQSRLDCFQATNRGKSYPDFNAGVYAMDVLFPLVQLEQQAMWIPDEGAANRVGWMAKGMVYVSIIMGWALSLLAVAGFSGLVKSD